MSHITGPLPENLLRCMSPEARKPMGKAGMTSDEATKKQEDQAEKDLHKQVVDYLEQHRGIKVGHARMDRKSTYTVGWPDLSFSVNGKACAIELKVGKNDLSTEQYLCISDMQKNGCNVAVARSLEEVKAFLERMGAE